MEEYAIYFLFPYIFCTIVFAIIYGVFKGQIFIPIGKYHVGKSHGFLGIIGGTIVILFLAISFFPLFISTLRFLPDLNTRAYLSYAVITGIYSGIIYYNYQKSSSKHIKPQSIGRLNTDSDITHGTITTILILLGGVGVHYLARFIQSL